MNLKPMKNHAVVERLYEEEKMGAILINNGRSKVNPFIVKARVVEDNTMNNFEKDTLVFCRFIGIQDLTGDETTYLVHQNFIEAVIEE
jgi:hypothetical protein